MGFETQEQAENWAENMEQRAKWRKEERLLASAELELEAEESWGRFVANAPGLKSYKDAYIRGYKSGRAWKPTKQSEKFDALVRDGEGRN